MAAHYLVNLDSGAVLRRVALQGRLDLPETGLTVSPVPVGRLWEDQPYAVVEATLDDSIPAGHRATGQEATWDAESGTVTLAYTTEAVPFAEQQAAKAEAVRAEGASRLNVITASYTPEERDTWAQQAAEADAYGASGVSSDAPMLAAMAAERSITLAEMVEKVNAARSAFTAAAGAVLGAQQKLETDVWAAGTQAALDAIDPAAAGNWP